MYLTKSQICYYVLQLLQKLYGVLRNQALKGNFIAWANVC